jgi:hypothetical protein
MFRAENRFGGGLPQLENSKVVGEARKCYDDVSSTTEHAHATASMVKVRARHRIARRRVYSDDSVEVLEERMISAGMLSLVHVHAVYPAGAALSRRQRSLV